MAFFPSATPGGRPRSRHSTASRGSSRNTSPHNADASSSTAASRNTALDHADASSSTVAAPVTNYNASESALRQHFQEVESSFLPTLSPVATAPPKGQPATDDTFLFDSPQKLDLPSLPSVRHNEEPDSTPLSLTTSKLEEFDSSPLKAAVTRTIERVLTEQQAKNVHIPDFVADELKESLADEFERSMIEEYIRNSLGEDIKESLAGDFKEPLADEFKESEVDEFKFQPGLEQPNNRRMHPDTDRGLTLKEQNSTIERLSKSNFDLKLKVSFLTQRLGKLSDENVNATMKANVDLKALVVQLQGDNKVLRKQIKELRKRIEEDEDRPSTSGSGSDPASEQREQELLKHVFYLEERLEKVTVRNETLEVSMANTLHVVEQVRHENSELRRDLGAQASMLTSRNREGEVLRQEIEDLKFAQGASAAASTADSILERSASRAGGRRYSPSRSNAHTLLTAAQDAEREELENRLARARDGMSEVKLKNQELEREIEACMTDFETQVVRADEAKEIALSLEEQLNVTVNDLLAVQTERDAMEAERDTALRERDQMTKDFESLQEQAQAELDTLDLEIEDLQAQLAARNQDFDALENSFRDTSEKTIVLEDEILKMNRTIQRLEAQLLSANNELEEYERKIDEESEKNRRLSVQQESSQSEIAFLREEQEADKIRIGSLETAMADEKDRAKELDERLQQERAQREMVANQEKQQVQQFVNELNREASEAKDEARRLRKNLSSREVEAKVWKDRLQELEDNLRNTLGDLNCTRSGLVESITNMQREQEKTVRKLDLTKATVAEKERIIKHRDNVLEQLAMDIRKNAHRMEKLERMEVAFQKLKVDHETLKTANDVRARAAAKQSAESTRTGSTGGCPSPSVHRGPGERDTERTGSRILSSFKDKPLMMRLKNMEAKLIAEREARDQDRKMARERLGSLEEENKGLRNKMARKQRE